MSLRRFFRRRQWDRERARELQSHLAHEIDVNIARCMTPEEARRQAYVKFGNLTINCPMSELAIMRSSKACEGQIGEEQRRFQDRKWWAFSDAHCSRFGDRA